MNLQQAVQPRSSVDGYGRRKGERETVSRPDHKSQTGKTNSSRLTSAGVLAGSEGGGCGGPLRDRLVYLTTCLIGHRVEVQVTDGSLYSGIFHTTNAEKDFGIILKMARSIRSGSSQGQKSFVESASQAPSKTLIIPAKDLVQITAKGVSVTRDGFTNDLQHVKQQDIMLDSSISQTRRVEVERELEPWVPDVDDPQCPELENVFDAPWNNRGWDQFEANKTLFGVKSTFDEELYTTKLERGPQMRDLEREAQRIAREIEGEETQDLHLAEERGIYLHETFDMDEETRFSSVSRGVDDSGYDENEEVLLESHNDETFGASGSVVSRSFADMTSGKIDDGAHVSSCSSSKDEVRHSLSSTMRDLNCSNSSDHSKQLSSEFISNSSALDGESRIQENQSIEQLAGSNYLNEFVEQETLAEETQRSKHEDLRSSSRMKKAGTGLASSLTLDASTSLGSSKGQEMMSSPGELTDDVAPVKSLGATQSGNSQGRLGSSASPASECGGAASASSGPGLSPSSSMGSLFSEKSTLNPHAKEFKLNPNAKSFIPTQTPSRPASPVSGGSFYFPTNVAAVPHMHGMPVGVGMGPSFAHQPVIFNPQIAPMPSQQGYFHPNGPQYGQQQMILGHPRQVFYMPTYPPEMPYKGRDF